MLKTVTFFGTLMHYAKELAEARRSGDTERIRVAEARHDAYRQRVLESDRMILGSASRLR